MSSKRACIPLVLLAGACLSASAQRKIVETPAGTQLPGGGVGAGSTNVVAPVIPVPVPGGNLLDRLARPGGGIQFAPPPDVGPVMSPGPAAPPIDPALRKFLLEEQARKKNWAIENAARINRGEGPVVSDPRRLDLDGRKATGTGRVPTAAELRLQAVDPKYAREFQRNSGVPSAAADSPLDAARERAMRTRMTQDPRKPGSGEDSTDPEGAALALVRGRGSDAKDKGAGDAREEAVVGADVLGKSKLEGAVDRLIAQQSGGDVTDLAKDATKDSVDPGVEALRKERDAQLAEILGTSTTGGGAGGGTSSLAAEGFQPATRTTRMAEFQQLLGSEPAAAPSQFKLATESIGGASPAAGVSSLSGIKRDLPELGGSGGSLNLAPATAAPAPAFVPPRITAQPAQLPFPARGKGGF